MADGRLLGAEVGSTVGSWVSVGDCQAGLVADARRVRGAGDDGSRTVRCAPEACQARRGAFRVTGPGVARPSALPSPRASPDPASSPRLAVLAVGLAAACQADRPPVHAAARSPAPRRRRARSTSSPRTTRSCRTRSTWSPGETVLLHVINGGLEVHEAVIGDAAVQDAWEAAEAAIAGGPPGPTPVVSVPPEVAGHPHRGPLRRAGRRALDGPRGRARPARAWVVGCHIPGHWAQGMQIPVHWVGAGRIARSRRRTAAEALRWYALAPARLRCALRTSNLEEDAGWPT